MARTFTAGVVIFLLTSCATQHTSRTVRSTCFSAKVIVTAEDVGGHLVAPGVPVDILVRSKRGSVLQEVQSDNEGNASIEVCWSADDPAWQVEAKLRFGPQFVGTFASFFNYTDTYCLTLPHRIGGHCGGTSPGPLLPHQEMR